MFFNVNISKTNLIDGLSSLGYTEQIGLVKELDLQNADADFTTDLVCDLLESFKTEFQRVEDVKRIEEFCAWLKEVEI